MLISAVLLFLLTYWVNAAIGDAIPVDGSPVSLDVDMVSRIFLASLPTAATQP